MAKEHNHNQLDNKQCTQICRSTNTHTVFFFLFVLLSCDKLITYTFSEINRGELLKKKINKKSNVPHVTEIDLKNIFLSFQFDMFELWCDNFKEKKKIKTWSLFFCASKANSIGWMELIHICRSTLSLFPYS